MNTRARVNLLDDFTEHTSSDFSLPKAFSRYFQKKVSAHLLAVVDSFASCPSESSGACEFGWVLSLSGRLRCCRRPCSAFENKCATEKLGVPLQRKIRFQDCFVEGAPPTLKA